MSRRAKKSRSGARNLVHRVFRFIASNIFGLLLAFAVFMTLPLMQMIGQQKQEDRTVRQVEAVVPPPPPPIEEEPPPPEDAPEPESQPEMDAQPENISMDALAQSLGGAGAGTGAQLINEALQSAVQQQGAGAFSLADLDTKPKPIQRVPPKYPRELAKRGISGTVRIEFTVDKNGRVVSPRVVSSDNRQFNDAAMDALRQWRFEPGQRGGQKVAFKMEQPIRFEAN